MRKLPPAYLRDTELITKAGEKLERAGRGSENMIPLARNLAARIRAFLIRWQHQPAVATEAAALAHFRELLLKTERSIEILHIATLDELLAYRKLGIIQQTLIEHVGRLADHMLRASPEDRLEMRRRFKETQNREFDPETAVAEQQARYAAKHAEYEVLLDEYERDWPDRLHDPHYLAILNLRLEQHDSLAEELHLMKCSLG